MTNQSSLKEKTKYWIASRLVMPAAKGALIKTKVATFFPIESTAKFHRSA